VLLLDSLTVLAREMVPSGLKIQVAGFVVCRMVAMTPMCAPGGIVMSSASMPPLAWMKPVMVGRGGGAWVVVWVKVVVVVVVSLRVATAVVWVMVSAAREYGAV
jgi:hypothetical protein